jgi:6,7-dimethyl-8-ribityllumazine synthase
LTSESDAPGRWTVVASLFNRAVTDRLTEGALSCLAAAGLESGAVRVSRVAGAWELALEVGHVLGLHGEVSPRSGDLGGVVAVGAIIRGETPHFDVLSAEVTRALMEAGLRSGVPVGFGLLTCDTMDQALARAGGSAGNKGFEAAQAALDLAALRRAGC